MTKHDNILFLQSTGEILLHEVPLIISHTHARTGMFHWLPACLPRGGGKGSQVCLCVLGQAMLCRVPWWPVLLCGCVCR